MGKVLDIPSVQQLAGELDVLIRSRAPMISLATPEEGRCLRLLGEVSARTHHAGKPVFTWSRIGGLVQTREEGGRELAQPRRVDGTQTLGELLAHLEGRVREQGEVFTGLYLLLDAALSLAELFGDERAVVVRLLRELGEALKGTKATLIFVDPAFPEIQSLANVVARVALPRPDADEVRALVGLQLARLGQNPALAISDEPEVRERLVEAMLGLTEAQLENLLARVTIHRRGIDAGAVRLAFEGKQELVRQIPALKLTAPEPLTSFGGYPELTAYLEGIKVALSPAARAYGVPMPKGALLVGIPGTGKTHFAKVASWVLAQNLWTFYIGELLGSGGSLVGSAEIAIDQTIGLVSTAGGLLLLDEYEKMFGGAGASAASDGGVMQRVSARFLGWLAEQRTNFVIATANRVDQLDPEQIRTGRFNAVLFLDLPDLAGREDILRVHVHKRGQDPAGLALAEVAAAADAFNGAELEALVEGALLDSFRDGSGRLATEHLIGRVPTVRPIAKVKPQQIERLRQWAEDTGLLVRPSRPVGGSPLGALEV